MFANQATAAKRRVFFDCRDATDGLTPETGEAGGQPQISTNGGSWTNTGIGVLVAIGNGRYYAELTQSAVATAGDLIETRFKSANTVETPGDSVQVVAFNPDDAALLGLSGFSSLGNLDQTVSSRASQSSVDDVDAAVDVIGTAVAAIEAKTDELTFTAAGKVDANVLAIDGDTDVPAIQKRALTVIHAGAVTGAASTTTLIDSGLTHTTTDQLKGRIVIFEGNVTVGLKDQATDITAFDPATDALTFTALTTAPAVGDRYVIV
jgi:hypothetical protein